MPAGTGRPARALASTRSGADGRPISSPPGAPTRLAASRWLDRLRGPAQTPARAPPAAGARPEDVLGPLPVLFAGEAWLWSGADRSRAATPLSKKERWPVSCSDYSVVSMNSSSGSPSGAEVRDRRGTADALNPDVLDPDDVGCNVVGGDDHLRGEGLVVTVTGAVEVCEEHDRVLIGDCRLQGLRRCPGALEGRACPQFDRVPANAFAGETAGQRALADVAGASEAAGRLGEARSGVVRAAASERGGTGWEAADVGRVEAEADVAGRRRRGRRNQENGRRQHRRHERNDLYLHFPSPHF